MYVIIKVIMSILIPMFMQFSTVNLVETTPKDAVSDFMDGLKNADRQTIERYMNNEYVNLLVNVKGNEETVEKMYEALFKNFSYKIDKIAKKNDVAVAKVTVISNDFSNVRKAYEKASYDYVMDNLYKDKIADKEWLNEKCFEIYVSRIEKAATGETSETVIYIPLADNGYYGWNILLNDTMMQSILGGLKMPG